MEDTQIDNLDEGLRLAFETLLSPKRTATHSCEVAGLNTRELKGENDISSTRKSLTTENRARKRMDVFRALCISLKNSTIGYDSKNIPDLKSFLKEKGINSNLCITREQLDYVHTLDLDDLEHFIETVDLKLLPQQLYNSTEFYKAFDPKGTSRDFLYEITDKNRYRVYINTASNSDQTDTFLTDYMKMCINKKIPFNMKGSQDIGEDRNDNTVLYLDETHLLEYLQILDTLGTLHPDIVSNFGTPPKLTASLSSKSPSIQEKWFGFCDLGEETTGTYNDRTVRSCGNAMIAAVYSMMTYQMKNKAMDNGYSIKALSSLTKFQIGYEVRKGSDDKRQATFLPEEIASKETHKTPLDTKGTLKISKAFIEDFLIFMHDDIEQIIKNPNKKQEMFEQFKKYYVLIENYYKYNKTSGTLDFEDFRDLPTTLTIETYQKYKREIEEKENTRLEQQLGKETVSVQSETSYIDETSQAMEEQRRLIEQHQDNDRPSI